MAVLMVLVSDVFGTAVLRVVGLHTPSSRPEAAFRRFDPVYHHGMHPNTTSHYGQWGEARYAVHTNSLGFKDASARDVPKTATTRRLLLIGDSFTEGVGIEYPDTFAGILAATLGDTSRGDQRIEVLNAGCVTYSPVIYRRRVEHLLQTEGFRFDHLVVCIDMSDIVDEIKYYKLDEHGNVIRRTDRFAERIKKFIADHTILMNFLRDVIYEIRQSFKTGDRHVVDHERSSWTRDPHLWEKYGKPGLESAGHHLDALWLLMKQHGIEMTVVVYPWPDQIINAERDCTQVTHWRKWTRSRGIAFIDAFPAFLDAGPAADVVAEHFIPLDMHWNQRGHALMAKVLLDQLHP